MQNVYERQFQFFTDPIGFIGDTLFNYLLYALIGLGIYAAIAIYKLATRKSSPSSESKSPE